METKNLTVKITDGHTTKVVHANRLQHCKQPQHDPTCAPSVTSKGVHLKLITMLSLYLLWSDVTHNVPDNHLIGFTCKAWGQAFKRRGHM